MEQPHPFERGPYIQVAAFCERVLREADGVISLIRVVDRVTHTESGPNPPQQMPEFHYPLVLVLTLKPGVAHGRAEITITPELPSGETVSPITLTAQMEGPNRGVAIISQIDIPYRLEGLYWFSVAYDGMPFTRMPLEVLYSRTVTGQPPPRRRS